MTYLINKMLEGFEAGLDKKDVQYFLFGKPETLDIDMLEKGVLIVQPLTTNLQSVATGGGFTDEEMMSVKIILAKSVQDLNYSNAQIETGTGYLARVFENKDDSNQLQINTIRYIVRSNWKNWGLGQEEAVIEYDTDDLDGIVEGCVTGSMTLTQRDHFSQPFS